MTRTWKIGENMPRRNDVALLRGEPRFLADRNTATAHMIVIRSPVAHGRLTDIDMSRCHSMPGFLLAIVAKDLSRNGPLPCVDMTQDSRPAHQTVLAEGFVRYVGEPVAAIIAQTAREARAAAQSVRLFIEPLTGNTTLDASLLPSALSLHGQGGNTVHQLFHRTGEPEQAFAEAHLVLDETFSFHRVSATPLEPRAAQASHDAASGRISLAATTQIPGAARTILANLLDMEPEQVTYERLPLGGGFGLKEAFYPEEVLVAHAARTLQCRVHWQESRKEQFVGSAHAREGRARLRMALDADGIVTALSVDGLSDIGAAYGYCGNSPGSAMGAMVRSAYRIPSFVGHTRSVTTNKTPLNVYRGAGHPQAIFAMERMMDRAAARLGLDRAEIRRRNLIAPESFPVDRGVSYPGAGRIVYDSGDYERCLNEALAAIDADGFAVRKVAHETAHPHCRLGLGMAMVVELTAPGPDESIRIEVGPDGHVTVRTAIVELGQGAVTALSQVLSDALGLDVDDISIHCGDGHLARSGGGSFASRGAAVAGAALADAARALKSAALSLAATSLGLDPETLSWQDGGIIGLVGRNAPLPLADLLQKTGPGSEKQLSVTGHFAVPASSFASACHAAVVSVDMETGEIQVPDYAVAHDCGTVLNPRGVDGQIIGGVMQGIGATLFETLAYDAAGLPLVQGFLDYPLPVAANVPRFHLKHIETPSPLNPLGMKGAGEGGFTGVPAALTGAIEHALSDCGIFLCDDGPYTPSRVLGLLRDARPVPPAYQPERICR